MKKLLISFYITFTITKTAQHTAIASIEDTENADISLILIDGLEACLIEKENVKTIIWTTQQEAISIHTTCSRQDLMKIFENINLQS